MNSSVFIRGNLYTGTLAFILQITALAVSEAQYLPDIVGTGIWGGVYLILFAYLVINKTLSSEAITAMAMYAILTGITLIGMNSWSISAYQPYIADCELFMFDQISLCGRLVIDSLLIFSGIVTVLVNGSIFFASSVLTTHSPS